MYFDDLGATATRTHRASATPSASATKKTAVALHPEAKLNVAAVQGQAAAEAALASTKSKITLFVVLGVVAVGGGWWFMSSRRKVKP